MSNLITECNVRFSSRVAAVEANDGFVSLEGKTQNGRTRHIKQKGCYLIATDGGHSLIRKQISIAFEGFTWKERILVLTTPFGFELERGKCYRNDITDPDEYCNCFKIAGDDRPAWGDLYFLWIPMLMRILY